MKTTHVLITLWSSLLVIPALAEEIDLEVIHLMPRKPLPQPLPEKQPVPAILEY